jgi:hypothetical protein
MQQTKQATFQWDSAQQLSLFLRTAATSTCLRRKAEKLGNNRTPIETTL